MPQCLNMCVRVCLSMLEWTSEWIGEDVCVCAHVHTRMWWLCSSGHLCLADSD